MKRIIFLILLVNALLLMYLLNIDKNAVSPPAKKEKQFPPGNVLVNYTDVNTKKTVQMNLEEYVLHVVAAEMPASFEPEALKAQALAVRTYSILNKDYLCNDVNTCQAFVSDDEMKKNWGKDYEKKYNKIKEAVYSTEGQAIMYNGELISAVYHSTSAGETQNSKDVWKSEHPYLKSVMSMEDAQSPKFNSEVKISEKELLKKIKDVMKIKGNKLNIKVKERYESEYVKTVTVNNVDTTGIQIRKILNLRSNCFFIEKKGSDYIFKTKGYGHGVGMSQYGANFMAKEGKKYDEIIKHYYSGVEIEKYN